MQLEVKTILNRIQHFAGFVYQEVRFGYSAKGRLQIHVRLEPHRSMHATCSECRKPAPGYDRLPQRRWLFVPLWGIKTYFLYAPRRVECPVHGVVVEHIPWSEGKRPVTLTMMCFLSRWARRLSWRETARAFRTSWECVYRSVEWFVQWGRLLWVGKRRTQATLRRGLAALGQEVVSGLRFVCSDMWRPYLNVIAAQATEALHVLDRFHITTHLNQAVDQVRRAESGRLRAIASAQAAHLKNMRWKLLRRGSRVRGKARQQLNALAASKLVTARAWILKEIFQHFWSYRSLTWARYFLDDWTWRALRSRIEPMMRVARMLRAHQELLLNWFRAKGEISSGAVEGLNNKIRVVTRRSYGFRTYDAMEIALYHTLGRLPEPELTHRFC